MTFEEWHLNLGEGVAAENSAACMLMCAQGSYGFTASF